MPLTADSPTFLFTASTVSVTVSVVDFWGCGVVVRRRIEGRRVDAEGHRWWRRRTCWRRSDDMFEGFANELWLL